MKLSKPQEKVLRDAVKVAWAYWEEIYPEAQFIFANEDERTYGQERILEVRAALKEALASTSDETEMETLRAWVFATRKELLEETPRTDPYDRGYLNALATVRDYITTQFLEETGE